MNRFEIVESKVKQWADARDITKHSTVLAQVKKAQEEMGELLVAAGQIMALRQLKSSADETDMALEEAHLQAIGEFDDAVGDVLVCLINACTIMSTDVTSCLEAAYHEIKDRKGRLLPNGIFQKEQ